IRLPGRTRLFPGSVETASPGVLIKSIKLKIFKLRQSELKAALFFTVDHINKIYLLKTYILLIYSFCHWQCLNVQ
ncbi:MAG TPA: hypothetical protein DCK76_01545, partial [Desulfotomaculum sp.]|nr:hypothetical protein [Desulfotomaculum sp.]